MNALFNALLTVDWYDLEEFLIVFLAIVIAPAIVFGFVYLMSKYKTDRKTEVILAAIEKGVHLDPAFYGKPPKSFEDKSQKRFLSGMIVGLIGVALCVVGAFTVCKIKLLSLLFFIPGGIMVAIGAALVISFIVERKAGKNK